MHPDHNGNKSVKLLKQYLIKCEMITWYTIVHRHGCTENWSGTYHNVIMGNN